MGINKVLLHLNERGDPPFLNLRSKKINNQLVNFDKNLSAGSISGMTLVVVFKVVSLRG